MVTLNPPLPKSECVCVLSPHPDDELLGCGGTLLKLLEEKNIIDVVYLTNGSKGGAASQRRQEADEVLSLLGFSYAHHFDFPDSRLEAYVNEAAIRLGRLFEERKYQHVFCPWPEEDHADHRAAYQILSRTLQGKPSLKTWLYEIWSPLSANVLIDVSSQFSGKLKALSLYRSQNIEVLKEKILCLARYRAIGSGNMIYAEAFKVNG